MGYIKPIRGRANLSIKTDAQVLKLDFEDKRVSCVRYQQHGREHVVRVSGEVILSGGAINSPQLLVSSISPVNTFAE